MKLDSKHFRPGNFVYELRCDLTHHLSVVTEVRVDVVLCGEWHADKPIHLNDDWFMKFGFKRFKHKNGTGAITFRIGDFEIISPARGVYILFFNGQRIRIAYVHKLQNLYADLYDDQLVFNEDLVKWRKGDVSV